MKKIPLLLFFVFVSLLKICEATAPMIGPSGHLDFSRNMKFLATCEPKEGIKVTEVQSEKVIWKIPQFYNLVALSDDGRKLVAAFDRGQTSSKDYNDTVVILTFFKDGKLIKEIRFKDLFPNKNPITEDGYFYNWGAMVGFNENGLLEILLEGKSVFYNAETGILDIPIKN